MTSIDSSDDPRLALYTAMKDRDIRRETGLFLAEGEHLVRRALEAGLTVRSVLVLEQKAGRVEAMLSDAGVDSVEVLTCTRQVLESAVGFPLHQGIIAAVQPPNASAGLEGLDQVVKDRGDNATPTLLVCPEITNVENLGLLARVAAGLGVGAMVLGPRCADPWYRRSVRVSMGAVFKLPIVRFDNLEAGLDRLRALHGYTLVATVTDANATPLREVNMAASKKRAILLGSEGYGLPEDLVARCDEKVRIPMHADTDSLNVAVAAGIVLHHYCLS
ncbi:MAG: RNA methyltransferase [Phycisphaeraceae bacterium]|nr:RNA methyltransferase [Phycisphaeraceae bacterium]